MKCVCALAMLSFSIPITAQVGLNANGPGDTYELINSVLAPGYEAIEVPDCGHEKFGKHIDEIFDKELGIDVFRFYIHTDEDDDRCINDDRQRNEIKSYANSPDELLGVEGETVEYRWKFKLDSEFQPSTSFTHLHQLKAVGGSEASMPSITLTVRKANPDRVELRYAEDFSQITLMQTPLGPFLGEWLEVVETVTYGEEGSYSITIYRQDDLTVLLSHCNDDIRMWKSNADFIRPKWGIYRSLNDIDNLRDEVVLFADFLISELDESVCCYSAADINSDGAVDIDDFLTLNTQFGMECDCASDLNGDSAVDVEDFLYFNSAFGTNCD